MANERPQNPPSSQTPVRQLRIDGERTAAMYTLSIAVSRLDGRMRQLAGVPTVEARRVYRETDEKFQRLLAAFEDGLTELITAANADTRQSGRNAGRAATPIQRSQQATRDARAPTSPSPAPTEGGTPAEPRLSKGQRQRRRKAEAKRAATAGQAGGTTQSDTVISGDPLQQSQPQATPTGNAESLQERRKGSGQGNAATSPVAESDVNGSTERAIEQTADVQADVVL